ncbi:MULTISPECIES: NAD(P)H-binding protein [unclassified Streptomyces]|uniref:SDR family oxidoreductase n=1 Tax=Streptomyces TaxID=1883 RepID=UPI0001C1B609|nr:MULTISPECIES: NAD(P)H-binding protein [unclassified Streptomyces]AEN11301.1 NAD-dependent epimerase/dehydratase [Streptomyces sp. SirexAA-E]MYR67578.1 NAD(P)H-binding protein [Streptomyces sp. SID4939]MYR99106.1 NAD(P)H-binding protein [Streptomyces sp. SID4940]MYT63433.1 NAD(P)H-binding protein [Streptomyces sp. SID8357]MYT85683.1 NAD(P)H-binding protein [Streptomyces sp. SID8360]
MNAQENLTVAVAGGTGTLGRAVAEELRGRGHRVRALSRRSAAYPVDLTTGEGLAEALAGCDVVVDASNSTSPKGARATLVDGSRMLLAAEEKAGVGHHVGISIVGCEKVPIGYYRTKVDQERVVESGRVDWTTVRATQFHELVAGVLAPLARSGLHPLPKARLQPVASVEVAHAVADVAERPALRGRVEVAGPEIVDLRDLALQWRAAHRSRVLPVPVVLPGTVGRALRAGALTTGRADVRGTTTFGQWLMAGR